MFINRKWFYINIMSKAISEKTIRRINDFVNSTTKIFTITNIEKTLKINANSVKKIIKRMYDAGLIERIETFMGNYYYNKKIKRSNKKWWIDKK